MAVTKTHPIKSTLKAAIDYILNPEKTDGKLLASSFGCGLETADIEFAWTREAAGDRGTHLGRHLIQSFAVGETTPEEAHKIGMELAGAVLGGKYEFVLTTHVDKDHLHNHLIFNAVSFVDYKKYHSNKQSYHFIRRTSDRICKEHGLSVVVPGQDKGKSYAEYTAEKQGTSYKAKLKTAIDTLIPQVKDFDELLRRLQEMGYEIKQGKYISFRAAGQERFTRTKTLGAAYTEEAIKERIRLLWQGSLARDPYPLGKEADIIHKPKGILKKPSLGARLKANRCEWCGKETSVLVMHQVRTLKELDESQPWAAFMKKINRKTLVVCESCHTKIHSADCE